MKGRTRTLVTGKAQQGFTLLELIVAMFILALIVGVVAVSIPGQERSLNSSVNRALGVLKACRNNAIVSGVDHGVHFYSGSIDLVQKDNESWSIAKRFTYDPNIQYLVISGPTRLDDSLPQLICRPDGLSSEFQFCLEKANMEKCIVSKGNGQFLLQK